MRKLFSLLVIAFTFLPLSWGSQEDEFISTFRQAHERKDIDAISALVYWKNVAPDRKELQLQNISSKFPSTIASIEIIEPGNKSREFKKQGKVYRPNLKVVKVLSIKYEPQKPIVGQVSFSESTYPLGELNGKYVIALAVPVE
jgi:hypothetical protein